MNSEVADMTPMHRPPRLHRWLALLVLGIAALGYFAWTKSQDRVPAPAAWLPSCCPALSAAAGVT